MAYVSGNNNLIVGAGADFASSHARDTGRQVLQQLVSDKITGKCDTSRTYCGKYAIREL